MSIFENVHSVVFAKILLTTKYLLAQWNRPHCLSVKTVRSRRRIFKNYVGAEEFVKINASGHPLSLPTFSHSMFLDEALEGTSLDECCVCLER